MQRLAGEDFKVNSTQQLRHVLFEMLGLAPQKKTKTGYSTDAQSLERLRGRHPIIETLLAYREVEKLRSTYGTGLLSEVAPDGRIHARFNQTVARTGRLSSDQPNLHNIPVRSPLGRQFREAFVPGEGCELLVADYDQIELRVIAHLAEDPGLIEAFRTGVDIHSATAQRVFGVDAAGVTPAMRSRAKMISYGLAYGMEAYGLSQRLAIPVEEAAAILNQYFIAFPNVKAYMNRTVADARAKGYTETLFGRRRYLPELGSSNYQVRQAAERQAMNAGIQGLAADIFKVALVRLDRALSDGGSASRIVLAGPRRDPDRERAGGVRRGRRPDRGRRCDPPPSCAVPLAVHVARGPSWAAAKDGGGSGAEDIDDHEDRPPTSELAGAGSDGRSERPARQAGIRSSVAACRLRERAREGCRRACHTIPNCWRPSHLPSSPALLSEESDQPDVRHDPCTTPRPPTIPTLRHLRCRWGRTSRSDHRGRPRRDLSLEEAIDGTIVEFDDGDIVKGTVVKVDKDEVLLDIGFKSEGVIPARELSIRHDLDPHEVVELGEEIEALVLQKEDKEGRLILSKKRAQYERAWGDIERIKESSGVVKGPVIEVVKGGLILDIGLRGFLPASLVELRRVRDLQPYIGRVLEAKIIELDKNRNNVVLSRRAWLEETQREQRGEFLVNLKPGEVRKGVVSSVVNFGAFVDLGGMDGLVHVSELSWKHVDHPSSVVAVGDEVTVQVLDVDLDKERISLSLKATQVDPWQEFATNHRVGELVYGRITKLVPFGAFVQVGDGIEGLVHISEMAAHHVDLPEQVVTPGEELWVKIIDIDLQRRRISLSIKQAAEGGIVAEEYQEAFGEHAYDEQGNYIGVRLLDRVHARDGGPGGVGRLPARATGVRGFRSRRAGGRRS